MLETLALKRIRNGADRKQTINGFPKIRCDQRSKILRRLVVLGIPLQGGIADPALQIPLLLLINVGSFRLGIRKIVPRDGWFRGGVILFDLAPVPLLVAVLTEVEVCLVAHLIIAQDTMQDLKFGDALALDNVLFDPSQLGIFQHIGLEIVLLRNPSVTLAQQSNEEHRRAGSAEIDFLKTNAQSLTALRLLLGYPPTQIHLQYFDKTLLRPTSKLGKNLFHQLVPLLNEIAEGGTDEDADEAGWGGHNVRRILISLGQ